VLALAAIASAFSGYESMRRAQRAEAQAQQTRLLAEQARGEAEKLVVYLLDDFYLELEPIGRLDIVASLAKRAVDYYAALPAELRTQDTERNRALALVRYGAALRNQSKLDESQSVLADAVGTLSKLRSAGDHSEATIVGLGLGLTTQARVLSSLNQRRESADLANQSVAVLEPMMREGKPSTAVLRAYGLAATFLGFAQASTNQNEPAVATLAKARDAYQSIDGLTHDVSAAAAYAEASAWQMSALQNLGRFDDLRSIGSDAVKVTRRVLEQQPGNMSALRSEGLIFETLSGVEWTELRVRKAIELIRQSASAWEAIVRLDPTNQIAWNNLADSRLLAAGALATLGEVDEGRRQLQAALDIQQRVKQVAFIGSVLALSAGYKARLDADSGDGKAAEASLAANRRLVELALRDVPEGSFQHTQGRELLADFGFPTSGFGYGAFAIPYADGNFGTVRSLARTAATRLEQLGGLSPSDEESRNAILEMAYRTMADASYRLRDYEGADAAIRRALALRANLPIRTLGDRRDVGIQATLAATIAARLGRNDEARRLVEPVLELQRGLYARPDNEDLSQHLELAYALYASAIAASPHAAAELKEAVALVDGLPQAVRNLISVRRLRSQIAEARAS
jgi:tetratricopeptide (TPR) repeat protein